MIVRVPDTKRVYCEDDVCYSSAQLRHNAYLCNYIVVKQADTLVAFINFLIAYTLPVGIWRINGG